MTLTQDEVGALARALDNYLPELRYELARVKIERDRHELVELEQKLSDLHTRMRQALEQPAVYV